MPATGWPPFKSVHLLPAEPLARVFDEELPYQEAAVPVTGAAVCHWAAAIWLAIAAMEGIPDWDGLPPVLYVYCHVWRLE